MGQAVGCACTEPVEQKDETFYVSQSKIFDGGESKAPVEPTLEVREDKELEVSEPKPEAARGADDTSTTVDAGTAESPEVELIGLQQRKYEEFLEGKASLSELSKTFADKGERRPSVGEMEIDKYVELHDDGFERLLALEKDSRWVFKKTVDGVVVHQFFDDKLGVAAIKAETEMDCGKQGGLKYILDCLLDPASRPTYDDVCKHGELLEQKLPFYRVSYYQLVTPTPFVSNRDALLLGRLRFQEDGSLLIDLQSIEHKAKPQNPDFVRIDFKAGGYILKATDKPGVWKVSFLAEVDPCGWMPMWLKNLVAWKQSLVLAKFKSKYKL